MIKFKFESFEYFLIYYANIFPVFEVCGHADKTLLLLL